MQNNDPFNLLDEEISNEELNIKFDMNIIKENIHNYDSKVLCDMIVCYRYLNFYSDIAILCMEELAKRRINGDTFDFEIYIESTIQEMPVLDFSVPDFRSIFANLLLKKL